MIDLSISTNFPEIERALDGLSDDIAGVVLGRALNRTADQARTAMSREIRAEFNLSAAKVREKLFVRGARLRGNRFEMEAVLSSRDPRGKRRAINVINFSGRQTAEGVRVSISKGGGAKTIKGAFIANKGRTVFVREGAKRLPIKPVQTIDVPQMFNTQRINARVVAVIRERFPVVFGREMAYALSQFGRGR